LSIINPRFLATFFGALVFTGLAVVLHLGEDGRSVLSWAVAALVLYLAALPVSICPVVVRVGDEEPAGGRRAWRRNR
jgi:hypothetical protein